MAEGGGTERERTGKEEKRQTQTERQSLFLDFNVPSTAKGHLRTDRGRQTNTETGLRQTQTLT